MSRISSKSRKFVLAAAVIGVAAATSAVRATNDWNGSVDATWDNGSNWSLLAKPVAGDDAVLVTPIPVTLGTITMTAGEVANSLTANDSYTLAAAAGVNADLTTGAVTVAAGKTLTMAGTTTSTSTLIFTSTAGTGILKVNDNGILKLKAGSGSVSIANQLNSGSSVFVPGTGGGQIDVSNGDTLTLTGHFATGTSRNSFTKTGAGKLVYNPTTVVPNGTNWTLRSAAGTTDLYQLPYRNNSGTGAATGLFDFSGTSTVNIKASALIATTSTTGGTGGAGGSWTAAAGVLTNFNVGYGFQQIAVVNSGVTGTLHIDSGAIFKNDGRPNGNYTMVASGSTLVIDGADDSAIFANGSAPSGGAAGPSAGGTLEIRGGTINWGINDTATSQPNVPTGTTFTVKLNGGIWMGGGAGNPIGQSTISGNIITNDNPNGATTTRVNGINLASTGNSTWNGTLTKNGTQPFLMNRTGGTATAAAGAKIVFADAATSANLVIGGSADGLGGVGLENNNTVNSTVNINNTGAVSIPQAGYLRGSSTGGFTLGAGAQLAIKANGTDTGTSLVKALSLNGGTVPTATLDITDNKLAIDYTGASVLPTVVAQIKSARNGYDANVVTNWDGKGIKSSTARTNSVAAGFDLYSVGSMNNADLADPNIGRDTYTSFGGQTVDNSTVLARYTYSGDADLNGFVDGDDYALIDNAYNLLIPNFGWLSGDFNYDGNIDGDDYALIDSGYLFQGAPLAAAAVAVPEPTTLGVLALGVVGLLGRRRRQA